jgi:hypothetical protein
MLSRSPLHPEIVKDGVDILCVLELTGDPDNNQPFGNFAKGLFCLNFFKKRRIFERFVVLEILKDIQT